MNSTNQGKIGSPSHNADQTQMNNDNSLSPAQLEFLETRAVKVDVDKFFSHYFFSGAPFYGLYIKKDPKRIDEGIVKRQKLIHRVVKRKYNGPEEDWVEVFKHEYHGPGKDWIEVSVEIPEKKVIPPTFAPRSIVYDAEEREILINKYLDMMEKKRVGCFWCYSRNWGYWGLHESGWLSLTCRSCNSEFYYSDQGTNSYCGMVSDWERRIRLKRERMESDPYLKWLLLAQGIEANPGPGENTKRDSKRRQPTERTRMEKLSNKHPDIYKQIQIKAEKMRVSKAQAKQFEQQMKALSPKLQFDFRIPVHLKIQNFMQIFEEFTSTLPDEVKTAFKWADIGSACYVLLFNKDPAAKYLACSMLYKVLGIQATAIATFSSLVFHVLKIMGYIGENDSKYPRLNGFGTSSIAIIMTLVLTVLFRKMPSKSRVENAIATLKDLGPTSRGMDLVVDVAKAACNYVKSLFVGPDELTKQIMHVKDRVKHYMSEEGATSISRNLGAFTELAELQQRAIEITSLITDPVQKSMFGTISQRLNELYRKASLTPIAGHANRKRPVVVHIWGKPGIGKTRAINLIAADTISTILSLDGYKGKELEERTRDYAKYVYFSPAGLKHEQNFNSHFSRIYVCDDANQVAPTNKSDGIDFPIKLISLNNSHDHMLPVAELEQKKDARFNSALIIATDNTQTPDLSKSITSEEAYYRRLDFSYEMRLKKEYSKEESTLGAALNVVDTSKVDPSKINTHIYEFYDPVHRKIYSYEEFIQQIISLLEHVHMSHMRDVQLFDDYAVDRMKKIVAKKEGQPIAPPPTPEEEETDSEYEMSSDSGLMDVDAIIKRHNEQQEQIRELTEKTKEILQAVRGTTIEEQQQTLKETNEKLTELLKDDQIKSLNERVGYRRPTAYAPKRGRVKAKRGRPTLHMARDPIARNIDVLFHTGDENVTLEDLQEVTLEQEKEEAWWFEKYYFWRYPPPLWFAGLMLKIYTYNWFISTKNRFFPPQESQARRTTKLLLIAFGMVVVSYGLWKFVRRNKSETGKKKKGRFFGLDKLFEGYGSGDAKGKSPPAKTPPKAPFKPSRLHREENEEVYKTTIENLALYANSPSTQLANTPSYVVQKLLCTNAYLIQIVFNRDSDGRKVGGMLRGFFYKGTRFIVNRHLVTISPKEWKTAYFNLYNIFGNQMSIKCSDTVVYELTQQSECHHDAVVIDFGKKVKTHVDLTRLFGGEVFMKHDQLMYLERKKCSVFTVMLNLEYESTQADVINITGKDAWYAEIQHTFIKRVNGEYLECSDGEEMLYTYDTLEYEMQGVPGYCGSVVVMNDQEYGGKIVGIHMAGYDSADTSYAQAISKEMIECLDASLQRSTIMFIDDEPKTILDKSSFQILGTIARPMRSVVKSKINRTTIHGKLIKSRKKPAHLGFFEGKHVVNTAMLKYLGDTKALTQSDNAIFKSLLLHQFNPTRPLRELDIPTAIKGEEGSAYIFPINRSSSPGYPLCQETKRKGKTEYLGNDENYIVDHPRVLELVNQYYEEAENYNNSTAYFVVTAKDELRLIEKVDQGKTRCFAAAPLALTIVMRQKYLDIAANIMENRINNSSLVGINCYSQEWDMAAKRLLQVSPPNARQFVAGDFSNFDGSLNRDLLWTIFIFMEHSYNRVGDPVSLAIWSDLLESKQIFGNAVVQIQRGHPSGHPLTAILNTLYNAGLVYLVLYRILDEIGTVESFSIQENLVNEYRALYYGDDNVISFSKRLADTIKPVMLPKMMLEYGHVYTTDTKDGAEFEYKTLDEVSILKRKFLRENGVWYAPLELTSIFEPLNWDKIKPFQYEEKRAQTALNMRIAIRELSLHPKIIFDEWATKIKELAHKEGLTLAPDCYYTQDDLRKMLKRGNDVPFFFSDSGYLYASLNGENSLVASDALIIQGQNIVEATIESPQEEEEGMCIHTVGRPESSPFEESKNTKSLEFSPSLMH